MAQTPSRSPGADSGRPRPERTRAPGAYLNLPLWQRYAVSLVVAAVLLTGMVIWVEGHNTDSGPANGNPNAIVSANRQARILVSEDQAPHSASLPPGLAAGPALERVLHAHVTAQIRDGALAGPLQPVRCHATGRSGARIGFSCTIDSGSVNYPFLATVDTAARRATYCKHDPPPMPSEPVPVSSRCRA